MRNLIIIAVFFCSQIAFSQLTEGYIQFSIDVIAVDTSLKTKQSAGLLHDSKMEIYFADKLSRIDYKMGRLYNTVMILDERTQKAITLTNSSKGKFASIASTKGIEATQMKKDPKAKTVYFNETKMILGYKCKKAEVTSEGLTTTYWYTNDINIDDKNKSIINPNAPGFPLAFSRVENGVRMYFQASNIQYELVNKEQIFSTQIPAGYRVMQNTFN
jgi:GLPGLI family protein